MLRPIATAALRSATSVGPSPALTTAACFSQRRLIHTHRTIFQLYQELASWRADWPLRPASSPPTDADPRQSMADLQRHYDTQADRWSPLQISEFISDAITAQSAMDRRGRVVHPSSFVDDLPWSFFSASRLATVPRLAQFAGTSPQLQQQQGRDNVRPTWGVDGNNGGGRYCNASTATNTDIGPLALMFHGSPVGLDILTRGSRFITRDESNGIFVTPSLSCARGYADIRRVDLVSSAASSVSSDGQDWAPSVSGVSAAALRQRGVLVCLVALGKVYHRYAMQDPLAEELIASGKWAIEGSALSDAAATAAESVKQAATTMPPSSHYYYGNDGSRSSFTSRGGGQPIMARGGHRRAYRNPNDDPDRPYDSFVDFVDGEQVYCVRNPDNVIPVVALALNKQAGLKAR